MGFLGASNAPAASSKAGKVDRVALGREIFDREWLPGDTRSHGGDGLGPVYNDTSCVACHNSGGVGGGGPVSKNIDILSASGGITPVDAVVNDAKPKRAQVQRTASDTKALVKLHAGFRNGRTVVLHKFGVDPNYQSWRKAALTPQLAQVTPTAVTSIREGSIQFITTEPARVQTSSPVPPADLQVASVVATSEPVPTPATAITPPAPPTQQAASPAFALAVSSGLTPSPSPAVSSRAQTQFQEAFSSMQSRSRAQVQAGDFLVSHSQRNATALFGVGLLDSIPESAIAAGAGLSKQFPEVQGRVSRLKDGRIGRLGWKGQTASVEDFVLTACAVELGLEVPGHEQSLSPQAPKYRAGGKDLTADECSALVAFVRSIPRPLERAPQMEEEGEAIKGGKAHFESIGCASCHTPSLGGVDGVYSDLLLHDMGPELADNGSYNGDPDDPDPLNPVLGGERQVNANRPATRQEWRTPPLWGFRDSAPYLHDGRADTLEQAVAGHGGQGRASALRFFDLSPKERTQLEVFLKSMVAPTDAATGLAAK